MAEIRLRVAGEPVEADRDRVEAGVLAMPLLEPDRPSGATGPTSTASIATSVTASVM